MAGMEQDKWLSPDQAAGELGVTTQRIRQLMASGQLRHERTAIGRLIDPGAARALRLERERRKEGVWRDTPSP